MDYEKAYKELAGKAKSFLDKWDGVEAIDCGLAMKELKDMFNEFTESEDERIRKWIYGIIDNIGWSADEDAEKELKEMQPLALAWLKKQGEQKPVWSEEDERIYKVVLELVNSWSKGTIGGCIIPPNTDRYIDWLKSLKDRVQFQSQWKPSDEQMELIKDIVFKDRQKITRKELAIFHSIYNDLKKLLED